MSMLYLTGSRMNLLAANGAAASPAAESTAPNANGYDGDPGTPLVWGSISAGSHYRATSLNRLTNAGFETAGPSGWTDESVGGGSATRVSTAGHPRTGSWALDLVGVSGAEPGRRMQEITVSAGEWGRLSGWLKITSGGATDPYFVIQNKTTGNYWNGTSWGSSFTGTQIPTASLNGATHTFCSATFQVESFEACRSDTVTLRVGFHNQLGTVAVDDTLYVPGASFGGIFGHNFGPLTPAFSSSDDDVTFTDRGTPTVRRGSFFSKWSMIYAEFWMMPYLTGTPHVAPYMGEVVLGQYQTGAASPDWGFKVTRQIPGVRNTAPGRRPSAYTFSTDATEDLEMTFSARTAAQSSELADALWIRSGQGRYPTIIVPIDTEGGVYYGRLFEPHTTDRPFQGVYNTKLMLQGDPLPTVGGLLLPAP